MTKAQRHKAEREEGIVTNSPEETRKLAADLAKKLKPGAVLALHGELGSGKTCFVQGLAAAFGVKEFVSSPTFTIINEYQAKFPIYHVDLYRVRSEAEIDGLGLEDCFEGRGITAIEWPEVFASLLPEDTIHIHFEFVDADRRRIKVEDGHQF